MYTGWHLMDGSDSKSFMGRVVWEIPGQLLQGEWCMGHIWPLGQES